MNLLANGEFTYQPRKNFDGSDAFTFRVEDAESASDNATVTITVVPGTDPVATVVGRYLFYNRSLFDGNDPSANALDDNGIATDKSALLPGGQASFDQVSSYSRGLNGVMIDLVNLPGDLTVADFAFKVGNDTDPDNWTDGPLPLSVTRRAGAGLSGSDRITLIWADYDLDGSSGANEAVSGQWLQITVLSNVQTCLEVDDVFYFGSAVGETGNVASSARVTSADVLLVRDNPKSLLNPAAISDRYDLNRDSKVNPADRLIARSHRTTLVDELLLIDLGGGLAPARYEPFEELSLVDTGSPWSISLGETAEGLAAVSFSGPAGAEYEIFMSEDLGAGHWVRLPDQVFEVAPGRFQMTHELGEGRQAFYNIVPVIFEESDTFPNR